MLITQLIKTIKKKLILVCETESEAEQQSIWILEEILQKKYSEIISKKEIILTDNQKNNLSEWIKQRVKYNKPIQYIFGYVDFLNLKLKVEKPILIPRPETEEWVSFVIDKIKNTNTERSNISILDIGTGSGCISLALAKNIPYVNVTGIDINPQAIKLAKKNKKLNRIRNVEFLVSDFYKNIKNQRFDIIISNPPYICENEWINLDKTVKNWEDKDALVAKNSCLFAYNAIISESQQHLTPKYNKNNTIPNIFLEIGVNQESDIKLLLETSRFKNIKYYQDLNKIIRMVYAKQ